MNLTRLSCLLLVWTSVAYIHAERIHSTKVAPYSLSCATQSIQDPHSKQHKICFKVAAEPCTTECCSSSLSTITLHVGDFCSESVAAVYVNKRLVDASNVQVRGSQLSMSNLNLSRAEAQKTTVCLTIRDSLQECAQMETLCYMEDVDWLGCEYSIYKAAKGCAPTSGYVFKECVDTLPVAHKPDIQFEAIRRALATPFYPSPTVGGAQAAGGLYPSVAGPAGGYPSVAGPAGGVAYPSPSPTGGSIAGGVSVLYPTPSPSIAAPSSNPPTYNNASPAVYPPKGQPKTANGPTAIPSYPPTYKNSGPATYPSNPPTYKNTGPAVYPPKGQPKTNNNATGVPGYPPPAPPSPGVCPTCPTCLPTTKDFATTQSVAGKCYCPYDKDWNRWAVADATCRASLESKCDKDSRLPCSWLSAFYGVNIKADNITLSARPHEENIQEYLYNDCPPAAPCSCSGLSLTTKDSATAAYACCVDLRVMAKVPFSALPSDAVEYYCDGKTTKGVVLAQWMQHTLWHADCSKQNMSVYSTMTTSLKSAASSSSKADTGAIVAGTVVGAAGLAGVAAVAGLVYARRRAMAGSTGESRQPLVI